MRVTVIGSHLCPDTMSALNQLSDAGVEINYKDILSGHTELKDYLKLRETSDVYAEIRGTERLGIPCFMCENGTVTLDLQSVLIK